MTHGKEGWLCAYMHEHNYAARNWFRKLIYVTQYAELNFIGICLVLSSGTTSRDGSETEPNASYFWGYLTQRKITVG